MLEVFQGVKEITSRGLYLSPAEASENVNVSMKQLTLITTYIAHTQLEVPALLPRVIMTLASG